MDFKQPRKYSEIELKAAAQSAEVHFRVSRREAEKELAAFYDRVFDESYEAVERAFDSTGFLANLRNEAPLLFESNYLRTLRYMERPTVSEDDFKKLSCVGTVAASKLKDPNTADLAIDYIIRNLNTKLFPWIDGSGEPSRADVLAAERSVAALVADQQTKTMMRNKASRDQESTIRNKLVEELGFTIVKSHSFGTLHDGPRPGEVFDKETSIDGVKADVVLGLPDNRIMALECKVSNTEVNSYKRLNHETVDKVAKWNDMFGKNGIVGGCVLQGVFKVENLVDAQRQGVSIFWSFDLSRLVDFIKSIG